MAATDLDALVYAFLVDRDFEDAAKALRAQLGVKGSALLARASAQDHTLAQLHARAAARAPAPAAPAAAAAPPAAGSKRKRAPSPARSESSATSSSSSSSSSASSSSSSSSASSAALPPPPPPPPAPPREKGAKRPNVPFSRVDATAAAALIKDERLADNSYRGACGAAGWGSKANDTLMKVKGDRFRHEKTKKKRGAYRGGTIDVNEDNTIRFDD